MIWNEFEYFWVVLNILRQLLVHLNQFTDLELSLCWFKSVVYPLAIFYIRVSLPSKTFVIISVIIFIWVKGNETIRKKLLLWKRRSIYKLKVIDIMWPEWSDYRPHPNIMINYWNHGWKPCRKRQPYLDIAPGSVTGES